jgi:hypothetical protein
LTAFTMGRLESLTAWALVSCEHLLLSFQLSIFISILFAWDGLDLQAWPYSTLKEDHVIHYLLVTLSTINIL